MVTTAGSAALAMGATKVVIDKRELNRTGPTYTADTLQELRQELGDSVPLIWLIGSDAFSKLDSWHHWQSLFELTHFAVVMRPGEPSIESAAGSVLAAEIKRRYTASAELHGQPAGLITTLGIAPPEVSSTLIRARCQNGESIRGLVPDAVCDYIGHHKLYLNRN